ncbi:MAG: alpha/beta hydrolase fold domain-containing protein [Deltaproteobacteria bacterium]|nr:alpha/beta hydrolase fold domain-containing protein [Deltaproteobacteria bacterium]MBW2681530.1 alpha/beta hydrolase fold domain-containing protein [Deltaproteobacteria bacterium]
MIIRTGKTALTVALMIFMTFGLRAVAQESAWKIGPRTLPASVDVSEPVREALMKTSTPDVAAAKGNRFKTAEEWEAWVKEGNVPSAAAARALAEALSVTIEEDMIADVNVHHVTPAETAEEHEKHLFVYIHGGAWVRNGGVAGTLEPVLIAAHLKMPVISIDYRMPPEHPAPAAIDDVVAIWKELLKTRSSTSMTMGGTSGGGNITLAAVHRFKDLQLALPGALYIGTPCVDIDTIGDSRFINEGIDRNLISWEGIPREAGVMYAGDYDHKHPYISPIYGNFDNFPPSYLISGMRDLLLSDTVRAHRKLRRAGVEADLHIYEGQSHGDYIVFWNAPESAEHYSELKAFVLKHLASPLIPATTLSTERSKGIEIPKSAGF